MEVKGAKPETQKINTLIIKVLQIRQAEGTALTNAEQ